MPAFSLLIAPPTPYGLASKHTERSLTAPISNKFNIETLSFGYIFEPRWIFSALFLG